MKEKEKKNRNEEEGSEFQVFRLIKLVKRILLISFLLEYGRKNFKNEYR